MYLFLVYLFLILFQVARLPRFRLLSKEILLDILDSLADEMSDSKLCQDMSSISLCTDGV